LPADFVRTDAAAYLQSTQRHETETAFTLETAINLALPEFLLTLPSIAGPGSAVRPGRQPGAAHATGIETADGLWRWGEYPGFYLVTHVQYQGLLLLSA
jgi:hypothetical protein